MINGGVVEPSTELCVTALVSSWPQFVSPDYIVPLLEWADYNGSAAAGLASGDFPVFMEKWANPGWVYAAPKAYRRH
jgi:hypothetical protein